MTVTPPHDHMHAAMTKREGEKKRRLRAQPPVGDSQKTTTKTKNKNIHPPPSRRRRLGRPSSTTMSTENDRADPWTVAAWEDFFERPSACENDRINDHDVVCRDSVLVPGEKGVFSRRQLRRGECCEWGVATVIPGLSLIHI